MVGFDPTTCHMQWVFNAIGEATESHRWPLHGHVCHVSGRFQYPIFQAPFFLEIADECVVWMICLGKEIESDMAWMRNFEK